MKNDRLKEKAKECILREAPQGRLPCRKAFEIAADTGLSTAELGRLCDHLKVKIINCQLGCF